MMSCLCLKQGVTHTHTLMDRRISTPGERFHGSESAPGPRCEELAPLGRGDGFRVGVRIALALKVQEIDSFGPHYESQPIG